MERNNFAYEGYSEDREDLERLTRIGVSGTEKAVKMANEVTERILDARGRARQESHDASLGYRARKSALSTPKNTVELADPMINRQPIESPVLPKPDGSNRQVSRGKKIVSAVIGVALVAAMGVVGVKTIERDQKTLESTPIIVSVYNSIGGHADPNGNYSVSELCDMADACIETMGLNEYNARCEAVASEKEPNQDIIEVTMVSEESSGPKLT